MNPYSANAAYYCTNTMPTCTNQYIERMGTGTGDMIRLCQGAGLPEPTFSIRGGFLTTIWRKANENQVGTDKTEGKSSGKSSGESSGKIPSRAAARVLNIIKKDTSVTTPKIASHLGISERAVEKQIRILRELEIIGRIGPAKGGHWEILP